MIICFGNHATPLYMDRGLEYSFVDIMDRCSALLDNGDQLYLEYHPGLSVKLRSPNQLELACQMVVDYHNTICYVSDSEDEMWASENALGWVDKLCGSLDNGGNNNDDPQTAAPATTETDSQQQAEVESSSGSIKEDDTSKWVSNRSRYPFGDAYSWDGDKESDFYYESFGDTPFNSMPLWAPPPKN